MVHIFICSITVIDMSARLWPGELKWAPVDLLVSLFSTLEGLAPYWGQTSSSCGGLVAFGHQMGALWAPWGPLGPPGQKQIQ